jgi:hypothetical protein
MCRAVFRVTCLVYPSGHGSKRRGRLGNVARQSCYRHDLVLHRTVRNPLPKAIYSIYLSCLRPCSMLCYLKMLQVREQRCHDHFVSWGTHHSLFAHCPLHGHSLIKSGVHRCFLAVGADGFTLKARPHHSAHRDHRSFPTEHCWICWTR